MCQDFECTIPFNIGNPPPLLRGLDILGGGEGVLTLNIPRG